MRRLLQKDRNTKGAEDITYVLIPELNELSYSSSSQERENSLLIKLLSIDLVIEDINLFTVELLQ